MSLSRKDLLRKARRDELTAEEFSDLPTDLKLLARLIKKYRVAGVDRLIHAPSELIERAQIISSKSDPFETVRSLIAELVYDSWARPMPAGIRGQSTSSSRRLSFAAENRTFDLRAEHEGGQWHIFAEVAESPDSRNCVALLIDGQSVEAGRDGLYEWSGENAPRVIKFKIDNDSEVSIPRIKWKSKPDISNK